jgi:hypothetical protein
MTFNETLEAVAKVFEAVGVAVLVVLIRTVLSFSLDVEIEGRLPWRSAPSGRASSE